jgi:pyruvate dehydrogenase E1 component alpha subunit
MKIEYTPQDLKDFEMEIMECFRQKMIRAPIHLTDGNETELIKIFGMIQCQDWVFCSWRTHYPSLLKGVPRNRVKQDIIEGRSMSLSYPEYRIMTSSIVGGIIPIATGVAFDIKRQGGTEKVWCFIGDMTSETGCFHENYEYSQTHELPITWIVEDNNRSVCTDTRKVWNKKTLGAENKTGVIYYRYTATLPHVGIGDRIGF